ncbi:NAD(P)/FAD-dependent oxidoreductase (plasmid) [Sphingobium sp. SJ10-10]|uniref:flavin-containing monooxygenase n=1 Tax=Sphingobium sp. SJ10-10 TaxID=3114999 RepID=UPI002E19F3CF|nr:NAD(P)/FAD-dependent oxidoreductase [Sphingobium sp. SJ10-10]
MSSPHIAIIGGGSGGIAMAVTLKRAGFDNFTILESEQAAGGTWYHNHYPGAACDIPSHLYSFSFKLNPNWSSSHGTAAEIRAYIEDIIDAYDLRPAIRFGRTVKECKWLEDEGVWQVLCESGEDERYDVVVSAIGQFNIPKFPNLPGIERFKGPKFHSARWEHDHDLSGKRIAHIGTGSTAAQTVPELAKVASRLYVFQREPGWILPKQEMPVSDQEREKFRRQPWRIRLERLKLYRLFESLHSVRTIGSDLWTATRDNCLRELERQVTDPEVREKLTPKYPIMCKRPVFSNVYLPTFNRPNVELVTAPIKGLTENSVVLQDGQEIEVDVVVFSTGFSSSNLLSQITVTGSGGADLHAAWREHGGAYAYLGMAVPSFPNFFMILGPNTIIPTSLMLIQEKQARFILRAIKRIGRAKRRAVEVRRDIALRYDAWVQSGFEGHPMTVGGCNTYSRDENGRITTIFPHSCSKYLALCVLAPFFALKTSRIKSAAPR